MGLGLLVRSVPSSVELYNFLALSEFMNLIPGVEVAVTGTVEEHRPIANKVLATLSNGSNLPLWDVTGYA